LVELLLGYLKLIWLIAFGLRLLRHHLSKSAFGASPRHRYGRAFISTPMPTIPSRINTSNPITIQPCNASRRGPVIFTSFEDGAGPKGLSCGANKKGPELAPGPLLGLFSNYPFVTTGGGALPLPTPVPQPAMLRRASTAAVARASFFMKLPRLS